MRVAMKVKKGDVYVTKYNDVLVVGKATGDPGHRAVSTKDGFIYEKFADENGTVAPVWSDLELKKLMNIDSLLDGLAIHADG